MIKNFAHQIPSCNSSMHKCQLSVKLKTFSWKTLPMHFTISYLILISAVKHHGAIPIKRSLRCIDMLRRCLVFLTTASLKICWQLRYIDFHQHTLFIYLLDCRNICCMYYSSKREHKTTFAIRKIYKIYCNYSALLTHFRFTALIRSSLAIFQHWV